MQDFRMEIDKYVTREPEDNFTPWVEQVYEHYSDDFYNNLGAFEDSYIENDWLVRLYHKNPSEAARIIERAYKLYYKQLKSQLK